MLSQPPAREAGFSVLVGLCKDCALTTTPPTGGGIDTGRALVASLRGFSGCARFRGLYVFSLTLREPTQY